MKVQRGWIAAVSAAAVFALAVTGCSSDTGKDGDTGDSAKAATALSAKDLGGLDALVAAAQKEGELNVVALPENWANYGKIIAAFEKKYKIDVNSALPDASSAEEIKAAQDLKGQKTAPDVFDLGAAVALANTKEFAPYKVETWEDIPAENKESTGLWVNDYTGVMSVGYDSAKVPEPTSLDDLLGDQYRGKVALNGDPTQAGAAFATIGMASLLSGGTLDDFTPGIDFFAKLNKAKNFLPVDPTPATIASGETPVVFDWTYNNIAAAADTPTWKTTVLPGTAYVSYYNQAVNVDAPHPAAARLWQEFIFSDEAQNLYLEAGAFPVRLDAMSTAGTVDKAALEAAGGLPEKTETPTSAQSEAANALLAEKWAAAVN